MHINNTGSHSNTHIHNGLNLRPSSHGSEDQEFASGQKYKITSGYRANTGQAIAMLDTVKQNSQKSKITAKMDKMRNKTRMRISQAPEKEGRIKKLYLNEIKEPSSRGRKTENFFFFFLARLRLQNGLLCQVWWRVSTVLRWREEEGL